MRKPGEPQAAGNLLRSYKPEELFDAEGRLIADLVHSCFLIQMRHDLFPEVNLNRSWAFVALLSWMVQARALDEAMVEHWRYIEAEVQKLPTDNPNFDVDLKPHDIDGPLIHCKSELESMDLIDHLIEIFTRGYALADATSRIAYIDAALDQIPQLGLFQRLELKAAAVSPFPEWTLGGLRQSSCRTLVPLEFVAGASRELLMGIVRERGGAGVSGGPGVPW